MAVTLADSTRLETVFAALGEGIVLLVGGGFLSIQDIRSVILTAGPDSARQPSIPIASGNGGSGIESAAPREAPPPEAPVKPEPLKDLSDSTPSSVEELKDATSFRQQRALPSSDIEESRLTADASSRPSSLPSEVQELLERSASTFTRKTAEFKWEHRPVPPLPSTRFPSVDLQSADKSRANASWSKAMDYLRNRNWPQAREELLDMSGVAPTLVEPVWGAAYAAAQQGDFVLALALLQHRGHLLASHPDLARVEVSLALQLGLIPSAIRLLRSYSAPPTDLTDEMILLSCRHGLYGRVAVLLSEEPTLWSRYGESLPAYLLLRVAERHPEAVAEHFRQQEGLASDAALQLLLLHSKDHPSPAYEGASVTEVELGSRLGEIQENFRDREQAVHEAPKVTAYITLIDAARRNGGYDEAAGWAVQGLSIAESRQWKDRFRQILGEIRKERPSPPPRPAKVLRPSVPVQRNQSFVGRSQAAPPKVDAPAKAKPRDAAPLWQQASNAADRGDLDEAIEKYRKYLEQAIQGTWGSQADKALNGLGMVYSRLGQPEEAIRVMLAHQQYVKAPLRFHNQIATMYFLTGKFGEAADHFTQAAGLATVPLERQKAINNAQNARERAEQGAAAYDPKAGPERDEIAEELAREYLDWDLNAPVRMREITRELDPFLEPDIDRLLKAGAEMVGIDRARVARGDYDYDTVLRLSKHADTHQKTQGLRSQYLASALYLIYQNNWHQNAEAVDKLNPARLQTVFAGSLGDDAAAQNRNEVAREYYACALERNPYPSIALNKVRDYIRTFTGERFDTGEERYKFGRFRAILENALPEGQDTRAMAIWGVLNIAGLSVPSYNAFLQVIEPVQASLAQVIPDLLPVPPQEGSSFRSLLDAAIRFVRDQQRRVEDQFHRFGTVDGSQALAAHCEAFGGLDTYLPDNPLDFGREGRVPRWRGGLVAHLRQYLAATLPAEKDLRYEQARSQIELARQEIIEHPTRFARRTLRPILDAWSTALQEHYENWEQTVVPELSVRFMQSVEKSGAYEIELLISNAPHSRTAHEVRLELELLGWRAQPLRAEGRSLEGGRSEPQSWLITQIEGENIAGSVPALAKVTHLDRRGDPIPKSIPFEIPVEPIPYEEIHNPYNPGPPVDRADMLKGRHDLVERLTQWLSDPSKCSFFRILGARRVGKSSILEAIVRELRDAPSILVTERMDLAQFSMAGDNLTLESVLQTWATRFTKAARRNGRELKEWNWDRRLPATVDFLDWIADEVRPIAHPVLILDEFQAIATKFDDSTLRDFVDFWKAMIERRVLSGVMCGMDSMDEWIARRGYGNQFASIKTEKVDYLSESAARELIEKPVLLPLDLPPPFEHLRGSTRYTEGAVKTILEQTARSPFYIQHFCHDVIHTLNDENTMLVTEMTVKKAFQTLTGRWDFHTFFDNLTDFRPSARLGDPGERSREIEGRILSTIALETEDRPFCDIKAKIERWPRGWRDEAFSVLASLIRREVVVPNENDDLHRIRVGLFRRWLQGTRIFSDNPAPQETVS